MSDALPDELHGQIVVLTKRGDELSRQGDRRAAYECYTQAWELIPEPKAEWETSTWVLSALGEVMFSSQRFDEAKNLFLRAVQGPKGLGNPYIHLRIGQCQYESGNLHGARENLTRAYMSGGIELFTPEDPKYLAYLREILKDVR